MDDEFWGFPNTATPPGSGYYYVARFSAPERRDEVAAWLAWFSHIDRITYQMKDPGVSRLKLDWWREEVTLARDGRARHPISRSLSPHLGHDWQMLQMLHCLDAAETRILRTPPGDLAAFWQQAELNWGSRMGLLAQADNEALQQLGNIAGRYYGVIGILQYLARDLRSDYLGLPRDWLEQYGLTLEQLQEGSDLPALAALCRHLIDEVSIAWKDTRPQLIGLRPFDPVLRLNAQAGYISRLLRRQRFPIHRRTPLGTPIGLLWSAWRGR